MIKMKKGFTLIELLVVIAIIAILAAILFPVFAQARDKARQSACLSNVKQIAIALQLYADDYDETFPVTLDQDCVADWKDATYGTNPGWGNMTNLNEHSIKILLQPYMKNIEIFCCPNATRIRQYDADYGFGSYLWNGGVMGYKFGTPTLAALNNPSSIALTMERSYADQWNRMLPFYHPNGHWWANVGDIGGVHAGKSLCNLAYADGHAKGVKYDMLETKDFGFYVTATGESRRFKDNYQCYDCTFKG